MANIENQAKDKQLGPPSPGFGALILSAMGGLGAGVAGTLILFAVFLASSTALKPVLEQNIGGFDEITQNPIFIFVVIATVFLASLVSNFVGTTLLRVVRGDKYERGATTVYQVFFINIAIFVLLVPIYLILYQQKDIQMIGALGVIQVAISALASVMILEIIGNTRYAMVGVYSVIFALLISIGLTTFIQQFLGNQSIVLFVTLPIFWGALGSLNAIGDMVYRAVYAAYGTDILMVQTDLGDDYGEEEEEVELPEDVAGGEFLKKK